MHSFILKMHDYYGYCYGIGLINSKLINLKHPYIDINTILIQQTLVQQRGLTNNFLNEPFNIAQLSLQDLIFVSAALWRSSHKTIMWLVYIFHSFIHFQDQGAWSGLFSWKTYLYCCLKALGAISNLFQRGKKPSRRTISRLIDFIAYIQILETCLGNEAEGSC